MYSCKHRCVPESTLTRCTARWQHIFTVVMDSYETVLGLDQSLTSTSQHHVCMMTMNTIRSHLGSPPESQTGLSSPSCFTMSLTTTLQVKTGGVQRHKVPFTGTRKPPRVPGGVYRDYLRDEATDRTRRSTFLYSLKLFR